MPSCRNHSSGCGEQQSDEPSYADDLTGCQLIDRANTYVPDRSRSGIYRKSLRHALKKLATDLADARTVGGRHGSITNVVYFPGSALRHCVNDLRRSPLKTDRTGRARNA